MRNLWLLFLVGLATGIISDKLFVSSFTFTTDDMYIEGQSSGDLPIDDEDGDDGSGSGSGDYGFVDLTEQEELLKRFLNFSRTTVSKEMVPIPPETTAASPHYPQTTAADSQDHHTTMEMSTTPFKLSDGDRSEEKVAGVGTTADWFRQSTSPGSTTMPPSDTTTAKFGIDISVSRNSHEDNSLDKWGVSTTKGKEDVEDVVLTKEGDNDIVAKDGRGSRIYEMESPEEVTSENLWERTEVLAAVIACGVVGFLCAVFLLLLLGYRMKKKDEGSYELGDTKLSSTSYQKAPTKEFYA